MRLLISVENTPYMAWQARVFTHSAITHLDEAPMVFVHGDRGDRLHPLLEEVRALATVVRVQSFRGPKNYAPRNAAGALLEAACMFRDRDMPLVLCDADMIFARSVSWPRDLSGALYDNVTIERLQACATRARVDLSRVDNLERLLVGVPYVVPSVMAERLAEGWLKVMDRMDAGSEWDDQMYALSLAVVELDLSLDRVAGLVQFVHRPAAPLERPLVHYAHESRAWDKRWFERDADLEELWRGRPRLHGNAFGSGTVLGEVLAQIRATKAVTPVE